MDVKPKPPSNSLLLRACLGEKVERTPVWAMRQAGRWDPEFRALRAGRSFYEFCQTPELAARAALCPYRFGVDAVILFYDITTLPVAMGQQFDLVAGRGPVPHRPIRTAADLRKLTALPDASSYQYVLDALRLVRKELPDNIPILIFAGAPFTTATYQLGIGKDLQAVEAFYREQPQVWSELLDVTANATIDFLRTLLRAGGAAFQLFDSWAGSLDRGAYLDFAHAYHKRIMGAVDAVSILFVKECPYLDLMTQTGARVVSLGKSHNLEQSIEKYPQIAFQGNVDHQLLVRGSPKSVRDATRSCLRAGGGRRHVLNLDHGMDPQSSVECFSAFVRAACES